MKTNWGFLMMHRTIIIIIIIIIVISISINTCFAFFSNISFFYLPPSQFKSSQLSSIQVEHINVFLQIVRNKMKYDVEISFEKDSEEDAHFQEYRKVSEKESKSCFAYFLLPMIIF